jgi:hypothetical protein
MQLRLFHWAFTIPAPRGHAASFVSLGLYHPSISRSHSTARHAHAKRTCGPLLFVIGTPNVAALHWRGCLHWHRDRRSRSISFMVTTTERNPNLTTSDRLWRSPVATDSSPGLEERKCRGQEI